MAVQGRTKEGGSQESGGRGSSILVHNNARLGWLRPDNAHPSGISSCLYIFIVVIIITFYLFAIIICSRPVCLLVITEIVVEGGVFFFFFFLRRSIFESIFHISLSCFVVVF